MKRIDENIFIDNVYGDIKIKYFLRRQSKSLLYQGECQICKRSYPVWIKDLIRGIGTGHDNCVKTLPSGKEDIYVKKLRNVWAHIVDRCTNPNCEHFNVYGGRGITTEYKYFIDFYDDFYNSYKEHVEKYGFKNTTIDRINPDGNYNKENLRWATWSIQYKNKRWPRYKVKNIYSGEILIGDADFISRNIGIKKGYVSEVATKKPSHTWRGFEILAAKKTV